MDTCNVFPDDCSIVSFRYMAIVMGSFQHAVTLMNRTGRKQSKDVLSPLSVGGLEHDALCTKHNPHYLNFNHLLSFSIILFYESAQVLRWASEDLLCCFITI